MDIFYLPGILEFAEKNQMRYSKLLRVEINFFIFFFIIWKMKINIFFIETSVFIKRRQTSY